MKKLHTGDPVIVIAGKHKGKVSTVERVVESIRKKGNKFITHTRVVVKGVNEAKRGKKGQGFITVTLPIHVSNVMYYDEKTKAGSRIGISVDKKSGQKTRLVKKTKAVIKK